MKISYGHPSAFLSLQEMVTSSELLLKFSEAGTYPRPMWHGMHSNHWFGQNRKLTVPESLGRNTLGAASLHEV